MWQDYICVTDLHKALELLADRREEARIVAGATDLILEMERGIRKGIKCLIDITRIEGLDHIFLDEQDRIHLGPLVTHNQCAASDLIVNRAFPLAQAAWEVGAPQIRNRGTIAGNIITASPANDTITPLIALEAEVILQSKTTRRVVPLEKFFTGVRKTDMKVDEILVDIVFPALKSGERGAFIKIGLRRAQAISIVNTAVVISMTGGKVEGAKITLGSVAPTIIRSRKAEESLKSKYLTPDQINTAAVLAADSASPIDDIRGSATYRNEMVRVAVKRALEVVAELRESTGCPPNPIQLIQPGVQFQPIAEQFTVQNNPNPIVTMINGQEYAFRTGHQKTLLRLLREEARLIGTKEGCSEGECGACTVVLDGKAVMSCLVPAPRAHGAVIQTIEGLRHGDILHPVQQSFIDTGAVQCGYCTPGFIMSAAVLLDERSDPSREEIKTAITGNLCRCTGYYKIIEAIEKSASLAT